MNNMLMKKRTILTCLPALLLSAACTKTAETVDPYLSDDTARVTVTLGLEGMTQTRASDDSRLDDTACISDGTRATTLIYALYDANRKPLLIKDPKTGEPVERVCINDIRFPYNGSDGAPLAFDLVKGLEYTLVFWAQSENGEKFYDTRDLTDIKVNYAGANNDEARDAFCVSRRLTITQDELDLKVVLRRPFAQINVGITKEDYAAWQESASATLLQSAISISGAGNGLDLVADKVLRTEAKISFDLGAIPHQQEEFGNPYLEIDLDRNATVEEGEKFVWASMCYILVPNYRDEPDAEDDADNTFMYSTLIDIPELRFFDSDEITLTPKDSDLTNFPVQNNHRTNIIFQDIFGYDVRILVDIDSRYAGDQPNE